MDVNEFDATLLAVRKDGSVPTVDFRFFRSEAECRGQAERFLAQHQSCCAVEVWRGGQLMLKVVAGDEPRSFHGLTSRTLDSALG